LLLLVAGMKIPSLNIIHTVKNNRKRFFKTQIFCSFILYTSSGYVCNFVRSVVVCTCTCVCIIIYYSQCLLRKERQQRKGKKWKYIFESIYHLSLTGVRVSLLHICSIILLNKISEDFLFPFYFHLPLLLSLQICLPFGIWELRVFMNILSFHVQNNMTCVYNVSLYLVYLLSPLCLFQLVISLGLTKSTNSQFVKTYSSRKSWDSVAVSLIALALTSPL